MYTVRKKQDFKDLTLDKKIEIFIDCINDIKNNQEINNVGIYEHIKAAKYMKPFIDEEIHCILCEDDYSRLNMAVEYFSMHSSSIDKYSKACKEYKKILEKHKY